MNLPALLVSLSFLSPVVGAQTNGPHHSNPVMVPASPSGFDVTWFGEINTTYFVEFSTDLFTWEYLPFSHRGQGQEVPFWYECSNQSSAMFLRVKWLENAPLNDADGDGAPDDYEVGILGSDPLIYEDWVKYLVDLDGDGIIDLDESILGLDPTVADTPSSEAVKNAGPVLITHTFTSKYHFDDTKLNQGQDVPGTWTQYFWRTPAEDVTLMSPISLADFRLNNSEVAFPMDGAELSRKDASVIRLKDQRVSLGGAFTQARQDTKENGEKTNTWVTNQTAHMLKLPFEIDVVRDFYFLEIPTYVLQEHIQGTVSEGPPDETEHERNVRIYGILENGIYEDAVKFQKFTIPRTGQASGRSSNVITVTPEVDVVPEGHWKRHVTHFIPVQAAPDVLRVNSDFDEGRIDPATGHAIPDCDDGPGVDRKTGKGNPYLFLRAQRDHLDGRYEEWDKITEDLHSGWFGIHPTAMDDHFWDGAEVTIKKLDQMDPDTGRKESGQVRFYATWNDGTEDQVRGIETYDFETLVPKNLVSEGVNEGLSGGPDSAVYGSNQAIPATAKYWMEGVRPGKITLEWRLKKGDIDVKYEQTFLVATQQSKQEWKMDLRYLIRLQTHDDYVGFFPNSVTPGNQINVGTYLGASFSYSTNIETMSEYYDYYRQCWETDKALDWAGLARTVGCQVVSGLSDIQYGIEDFSLATHLVGGVSNIDALTVNGLQDFQNALFHGGFLIFDDLAWQHEAFLRSGLEALDYVSRYDNSGEGNLSIEMLEGWSMIAEASSLLLDGVAIEDVNSLLVDSGRIIADHEQNRIIQQAYDAMGMIGDGLLLGATGPLSKPPFAGCLKFTEIHGGTENIGSRDRRWEWVEAGLPGAKFQSEGVIKAWSGKSVSSKGLVIDPILAERGKEFSRIFPILNLPVKVADHLEFPLKQ